MQESPGCRREEAKSNVVTRVSLREHGEMWGIARREGRMVQSEDVNGGGLQRRGEEYSSEENCEKGKGRALERLGIYGM